MSLTLSIPIIVNGTQKTVDFNTELTQLGNNYQQLAASIMGEQSYTIQWQLVSVLTEYVQIQSWVDVIENLGGGVEVLIYLNEKLGTRGFIITGYSVEYATANKGTLLLQAEEIGGGEYRQLAELIPTSGLVDKTWSAYQHIVTYSTSNDTPTYAMNIYIPYNWVPTTCFPQEEEDFYQPAHGGTTKDITALVNGMLRVATIQTNSTRINTIKTDCINMHLTLKYLSPTANPSATVDNFIPHWRYTAKYSYSTSTESLVTPNVINSGYHTASDANFTFTRVGTSNQYVSGTISNLARVFSVNPGSQGLAARYVFAPKLNPVLDNVTLVRFKNGGYEYSVGSDGNIAVTGGSLSANTVLLSVNDTGEVSPFRVIHTKIDAYQPAKIKHECFPVWRLPASNEYNFEFEVTNAYLEMYELLKRVTNTTDYDNCISAVKLSVLSLAVLTENLTSQNFFIFKEGYISLSNDTAYVDDLGLGVRVYGGLTFSIKRNITVSARYGWIVGDITAYTPVSGTYYEARIRNSVSKVSWNKNTRLSVTVFSAVDNVLYLYIDTAFTQAYNNTSYFAPIFVPANTTVTKTFNYCDFISFFDNTTTKTVWWTTVKRAFAYTYGDTGSINTITRKNVNFTLNNPTGITTQPLIMEVSLDKNGTTTAGCVLDIDSGSFALIYTIPKIMFNIVSGSIRWIFLDSANKYFYVDEATTGWQYKQYKKADLIPFVSGDVINDQAPLKQIAFASIPSISVVQIYYVGEPPRVLPVDCFTYETAIGDRLESAHSFEVKNVQILSSETNYLPYTPGVVPMFGSLVGTSKSWFLEPSIGTQLLTFYKKMGRVTEANNVTQFYTDAQLRFLKDSGVYQYKGFFAPNFHWSRFAAFPKLPFETWSYVCSLHPYLKANKAEYQYNAFLDAANALYIDPNDLELKKIVENTLQCFIEYWLTNGNRGNPPDTFSAGNPPTRTNKNILGASLVLMGAIYANLAGCNRMNSFYCIFSTFEFLESEWVASGSFAGSWTKNMTSYISYPLNRPKWHGMAMQAYSFLYEQKVNLRYPTKSEWGSLF
jgi:hypothetical protein